MKKLVFCLRVFYTVINTYFLGGVMKQGFTLIELLVVVLIIGLLTAIALPHYSTAIERSRAAEAFANGRTMLEAANRALDLQPNKTPVRTDLDVHISGGQWIDDSTYKTPDFTYTLANGWVQIDRDLDGDGTVEIPTQPDEAGLLNMSQSRRMDFIVWMDYTASAPEKSFGLLDEETGCYIALPIEWEGNLMLTDSTDEEDAVELWTVDENKLVLTLRLASSSENAVGWTRLGVVASRQMQAKLGPDVTIEDPDYRLSRSLYRLN